MTNVPIGMQLKLWRIKQGFSALKLAEVLGISKTYMSAIERERRPLTDDMLRKLSEMGFVLNMYSPSSDEGGALVHKNKLKAANTLLSAASESVDNFTRERLIFPAIELIDQVREEL